MIKRLCYFNIYVMRVRKYLDFIKEEFNETPESYISTALSQIKQKVDKMFDFQEGDIDNPPEPEEDPTKIKKISTKDSNKMTFEDLGVTLESSEISKYSKLYDSLTVKFTDDSNTYTLIIMIDIKEAIPTEQEKEKNFDSDDIEDCYIKFKKYSLDNLTEIIGQLNKNIKIKDIDEEFLIDLKIELDEKFGGEEDDFEIETN
jgi:hypothetical protein